MLQLGTVLCVLDLLLSIQMSHQANFLDMMPITFDDQYIGCADKMEKEMPKILAEELKYDQFAEMWNKASQAWNRKGLTLPSEFDDKYGTAVVLYTMQKPYSIYRQLNGNISIAGESRDFYMNNFHFKALHFYLTRALQVLRTDCANMSRVYRGTEIGAVTVAKEMRFDRFTSSSKSRTIAEDFGKNPFFNISTCYGVDIADLSAFEEQEFLIPIGETFDMIKQTGTTFELKSTGKLCSYFNCAYLGGEKRSSPVCNSGDKNNSLVCSYGEARSSPVCSSGPAIFQYSGPGTHFTLIGLTVTLNLLLVPFV